MSIGLNWHVDCGRVAELRVSATREGLPCREVTRLNGGLMLWVAYSQYITGMVTDRAGLH